MKALTVLAFLALSYQAQSARIIYVKTAGGTGSGLDSNANAWSLAKLNSMYQNMQAGDTVKLRSGEIFTGPLNTAGDVYYTKYGNNANPVITGTTTLTSWAQYSGNIYYATISSLIINGVSLDGVIQSMGRYPNGITNYLQYTSNNGVDDNPATPGVNEYQRPTAITGTAIGTIPFDPTGGEVVIKNARYILDRHKILSRSGNTINYRNDNKYGDGWTYTPTNNNGCFVQGTVATLDQIGEWAHDSINQRLYMHFGTGTPTGKTIKVNTVNTIVGLASAANSTFKDLDFEGGENAVALYSCDNIKFINCNFNNSGVGVYGNYTTNTLISGGSIKNCYQNGTMFDDHCDNNTFTGVTLYNNGMIPGISRNGDYAQNGILLVGNGNKMKYNTVKRTGYNGIYFEGSNDSIATNLVDSFNLVKDDGGGIYTYTNVPGTSGSLYTGTMAGRVIRNNIVTNAIGCPYGAQYDGDNFGKAPGIYLDGYSNHTEVSNNHVSHGNWIGIFLNSNSDNTITGNTTYDFPNGLCFYVTSATPGTSGYTRNLNIQNNKFIARTAGQFAMQYNLFVNDNPSLFGTQNNNVYARPISEGTTIQINKWYLGSQNPNNYSVATWKSGYGLDQNSTASAVQTTDPNDFYEITNATAATATISLPRKYRDVKATQYTAGSRSLTEYQGDVLLDFGPLDGTPPVDPPAPPAPGKPVKKNGKVLKTPSTNKRIIQ